MNRHLQAAVWTVVVGGILTLFVGSYIHLMRQGDNFALISTSVELQPFAVKDEKGQYLGTHNFLGKTTLLIHLQDSSSAEALVAPYADWAKQFNIAPKDPQKLNFFEADYEKNIYVAYPVQVVIVAPKLNYLPVGSLGFFGQTASVTMAGLVWPHDPVPTGEQWYALIDHNLMVRERGAIKDLDSLRTIKFLSSMRFHHSMDEYLSRRTFFGPTKKKVSTQ